jgi:hypothetical protein
MVKIDRDRSVGEAFYDIILKAGNIPGSSEKRQYPAKTGDTTLITRTHNQKRITYASRNPQPNSP